MKKVFSYLLLVAAFGMVAASCTPQKQSCAAYNNVEIADQKAK